MAYQTTGKPVGRPKTKDYKTISLKMPQELLDRVQAYARLHRQSISELIRDGVEWRITDGDPRSLGVSAPQRARSDDSEYSGNTVIQAEVREESEHAGMLEEIRTALARQETQLHALTQALEHHAVVPPPGEYFGNTTHTPSSQQSTPEPAQGGDASHGPSVAHEESGNTVVAGEPLADAVEGEPPTVVAVAAVPPFDRMKHHLGKLCRAGHEWGRTGQSLRANNKAGYCLACNAALNVDHKRAARQRKRQAQPA